MLSFVRHELSDKTDKSRWFPLKKLSERYDLYGLKCSGRLFQNRG